MHLCNWQSCFTRSCSYGAKLVSKFLELQGHALQWNKEKTPLSPEKSWESPLQLCSPGLTKDMVLQLLHSHHLASLQSNRCTESWGLRNGEEIFWDKSVLGWRTEVEGEGRENGNLFLCCHPLSFPQPTHSYPEFCRMLEAASPAAQHRIAIYRPLNKRQCHPDNY